MTDFYTERFYDHNNRRAGIVGWRAGARRFRLVGYGLHHHADMAGTDQVLQVSAIIPHDTVEHHHLWTVWRDGRTHYRGGPVQSEAGPAVTREFIADIRAGLIVACWRNGGACPLIDRLMETAPDEVAPLFHGGNESCPTA